MYRIDNPSAVVTLQAPPAPGTQGYFTGGNPAAGLEATRVDAWWLNTIQEELIKVIAEAGIALDKSNHTQLWEALDHLFGSGAGTLTEAPGGGLTYGRQPGQWVPCLPLTGGVLYNPTQTGAADDMPLQIRSNPNRAARVLFNVDAGRRWDCGVATNGTFAIGEYATAGVSTARLTCNPGGTVVVGGRLEIGDTASVANRLDAGQIYSAAITTTGYSLPADATNFVWSGSLVASNALMINVYFNSTLGFRHAQNETGAVIGASPNPVDPARAGITFGWTAAGAQGTAAPTSELMFLGSTQSRINCQQLVLQANLDVANDALAQSLCPHFNNTGFVGTGGLGWAIMNSYNFNNLSDISTKRDIRLSATGALDHVKAVPVSEFHWLNEDDDAPLHRGFVAQDVRRVMGDDFAGCCEQDGVLGWSLNEMLAVLWQGVQELAAKVDALEARGG